jgi:hypothetical protein
MSESVRKQEIDNFKLEIEKITQKTKNITSELEPLFLILRKIDNQSREFGIFSKAAIDFLARMGKHIALIDLIMRDWSDYLKDIQLQKIPKVEIKDIMYMLFFTSESWKVLEIAWQIF